MTSRHNDLVMPEAVTHPVSSTGSALAGCTILVTADRRAGEFGTALARRGAVVRHAPSLSIVPHVDDETLLRGTRTLLDAPPDVVVITTGIGFRGWVEVADAAGLADRLVQVLGTARLVARGPKARGALQAAGLQADWVAQSATTAEIQTRLLAEGVHGARVVVQSHGAGAGGLEEALAEAGAAVQSLVVYRWGPPPDPDLLSASTRWAASGDVDAVVFTSAPGAEAWLRAARDQQLLGDLVATFTAGNVKAAAIGPVAARPLLALGIEPLLPETGRLGALVRTLVAHFGGEQTAVSTSAGQLQVRRCAAVLDGRPLPVSPAGLALLRRLADDAGSVVARSELLAALPGGSADPHAAEMAVARLREALGDKDMIRTVVKRGYLLRTGP